MGRVFSKWFDTVPRCNLTCKTQSAGADVNPHKVGAKLAWQAGKFYKSPLGLSCIWYIHS